MGKLTGLMRCLLMRQGFQKTFGLKCRHAALSSGRNRLTIVVIYTVAGSKDARHTGKGISVSDEITGVVAFQKIFKYGCIRLMSNSQEQPAYRELFSSTI